MKCPHCGAENVAGTPTCSNCGKDLQSIPPTPEPTPPTPQTPSPSADVCAKCGEPRSTTANFCPNCGEKYPETAEPTPVTPTPPEPTPAEPTPVTPTPPEPTPAEPTPPVPSQRGVLEITTIGGEIIIDSDSFRIGRSEIKASAKQPVPDEQYQYISRVKGDDKEQFRILREAGQFFIEDRGSANGTRLNGQDITNKGKQPLKDGDTIEFASFECKFRFLMT